MENVCYRTKIPSQGIFGLQKFHLLAYDKNPYWKISSMGANSCRMQLQNRTREKEGEY